MGTSVQSLLTSTMKVFAVFTLCIAAVTVNEATVMCNCVAPNAENYVRMNTAHADCIAYPHDTAGHASCIANSLGFLSVDGRNADVAGLQAMFGDAAGSCDADSILAANFEAKGWVWPGVFDFPGLDSALESFLECAQSAAVMICEDNLRASLSACSA